MSEPTTLNVEPSDSATGAVGSDILAATFPGPSEMAVLGRQFDWATTPVGPIAGWPVSLRTATALVIGAAIPMILLWGPELVQIYNDGYAPFLAAKHPGGLGQPTREIWPEVWHINAPLYARVRAGETVALEAAHFPVTRQGLGGPAEDLYISIAYSPVYDETNAVGGVLITLHDVTARVVAQRIEAERVRLLEAIANGRTELLAEIFQRAPSFLHVLRGPDFVFELVNPAYYQLVGYRELLGRPAFEAMP